MGNPVRRQWTLTRRSTKTAMLDDRMGSIFDAPVQALVNPVNCQGIMGAGLAIEFRQRFPAAYESYHLACRCHELTPGIIHPYRLPNGRWIAHFPTKALWRNPARMAYISAGLPNLVEFVRANSIKSIAIPALGCGRGGLNWSEVKPRIEKAFQSLPKGTVDVWLFGPQGR